MSREPLGQVVASLKRVLVSGSTNQRQAIWIARIVVISSVTVLTLILATTSGFISSKNAAVVGALVAFVGVLITQVVNASIARSAQMHAQYLADQRAQDDALQAYFDRVGKLLIDNSSGVDTTTEKLSIVARAQTLTLLEGLDPIRKRIVLLFLHESALIDSRSPIVSLRSANFRKADLTNTNLSRANLSRTVLRGVDLRSTNLSRSDLSTTDLVGADLTKADLSRANLRSADLSQAILQGAKLDRTDLRGADLSDAYLNGVDLQEADLRGADVKGADLSSADLSGSKVTSKEQLAESQSLEGATMPDDTSQYYRP